MNVLYIHSYAIAIIPYLCLGIFTSISFGHVNSKVFQQNAMVLLPVYMACLNTQLWIDLKEE